MQKKLLDARMLLLLGSQLLVLIVVLIYVNIRTSSQTGAGGLAATTYKDTANKLQAAGIIKTAIANYEKYFEMANISTEEKAAIAFSLGTLYEEDGAYEQALSWFYKVELIDPRSEDRSEANKRIVALLEKMKKFSAAQNALAEKTNLDKGALKKGGQVIAEIEGRPVYLHQINEALDLLPAEYKKEFVGKEGKQRFVQKYIADELLYTKAKKLQIDRDPAVRKQMDQIEQQILVQKLVETEIKDKVKLDSSDVKNYFQANKEKFSLPERAEVAMLKVKEKSLSEKVQAEFKSGKTFASLVSDYSQDEESKKNKGLIPQPALKGKSFMGSTEFSDKILATPQGKISTPVLFQGYYYVFQVIKKYSSYDPKFEEVKAQVENEYKMEKIQGIYQGLINETLKAEDVKLYLERIEG